MNCVSIVMISGNFEEKVNDAKLLVNAPLLGKPVYQFVLDAVSSLSNKRIFTSSDTQEEVVHALLSSLSQNGEECAMSFSEAMLKAIAHLPDHQGKVLVVSGNMPCVDTETYQALLDVVVGDDKASCLYFEGNAQQEPVLRLGETAYCFDAETLERLLSSLAAEPGDYSPLEMLTEFSEDGAGICPVYVSEKQELVSVRTRSDFAKAFACVQNKVNARHMSNGVFLLSPQTTYIEADVSIGPDTVVYPGCLLQGNTKIGSRCTLLPNSRMKNAELEDEVTVESSVLLDCYVGAGTTVGPFAYLRPSSKVGKKCRIGDFVEIKNSNIGDGTKVSHLTYVGDGDLGKDINLGCGVVFVNYNGKAKQRCVIEDHAFVGCNVNLIAPVHVGKEAYVAAGSTVTEDVPAGSLYIARAQGATKEGWVAKRKEVGKL